jgi:DNA-binding SARP family transcriptional activator
VASGPPAAPVPALIALVALTVAEILADEAPDGDGIERLSKSADQLGLPWFARLIRALLAWTDRTGGDHEAEIFAGYAHRIEDPWGQAMAALILGVSALRAGRESAELLETAIMASRTVGSGVLEAWSRAAASVGRARAGDPEARAVALQAETIARTAGVRGAQALAFAALGMLGGRAALEYAALADAIADECGLSLPALVGVMGGMGTTGDAAGESGEARARMPAPALAPVALRCFGGFDIKLFGEPVDTSAVRPRARAALHLLALHAPRPVHRDSLVEALWPETDPKAGARNLHVVISSLRQLLEPGVARGASSLVVREGESYRLDLPAGSVSDLASFRAALDEARSALANGDAPRAAAAFGQALDLYRGDLLAGHGSSEWLVRARDRFRWDAVGAAQALAELELARGDAVAAAAACDRGLRIDRYRDPLWRLRVRASEAMGDVADAARARQAYRDVLAELGIDA